MPATALPEVFVGAERLHPRVGDLAADGVEAEALEVVAVGGRLVDPGVLRRVAGTGGEIFAPELVVDHRAEQVARPAVHEEVAVGRDVERHRPGRHPQRGVEIGGRREERTGREILAGAEPGHQEGEDGEWSETSHGTNERQEGKVREIAARSSATPDASPIARRRDAAPRRPRK